MQRAVELAARSRRGLGELAALYAARGDTGACDAAYARFTRLAPPEQHLAEAAARARQSASGHRRGAAAGAARARAAGRRARCACWPRWQPSARITCEAEALLGRVPAAAPGYSVARFDLARVLHSQQKAAPMLPLLERLLALRAGRTCATARCRRMPTTCSARTSSAAADSGRTAGGVPRQRAGVAVLRPLAAHRGTARGGDRRLPPQRAAQAPSSARPGSASANLKTCPLQRRGPRRDARAGGAQRICTTAAACSSSSPSARRSKTSGTLRDSFAHYARGNALRRAQVRYDRRQLHALGAAHRARCTRASSSPRAPSSARRRLTRSSSSDCRAPGSTLHRADPRQPLAGGRHARATGHARRSHSSSAHCEHPGQPPARTRSRWHA